MVHGKCRFCKVNKKNETRLANQRVNDGTEILQSVECFYFKNENKQRLFS